MIDMQSMIDGTFRSTPDGGVRLIRQSTGGDYTGPGGTWQVGKAKPVDLLAVSVQPVKPKESEMLMNIGAAGVGATINPSDCRVVHINDGVTYLQADDEGREADMLEFSDGLAMRTWRVIAVDSRPWHRFCRAIVQRYRGSG